MAKEVTVEKVSNARVRVKERLRGTGARLIRSIETMAHTSNGRAMRLFAALRPGATGVLTAYRFRGTADRLGSRQSPAAMPQQAGFGGLSGIGLVALLQQPC